ncbi:MAG: DinB family protein, partial [Deinococcota bacterium]
MTDLIAHAQLLARYNRLANQALLDVCQTLPETILLKAQGASFDSVLGTLNHLLIGDCIWLNRFEGSQAASTGLGKMPYPTLTSLIPERQATDVRIEQLAANLDATWLAG